MTTALAVTSPDHVLSPPDRHTPGAHVFRPPEDQPLEVALAQTQSLVDQYGYLVVVHPHTLPTAYLHRLHALRALLESDRIALLPSRLPPLGIGVLVRQLRQLSLCEFSPGVLGSAARLLTHYVHAGALLGSVARLDQVPVSLTAHAKSWLPGAQFAVTTAPGPQLVRLGAKDARPLAGPQFATRLTVAPGSLDSDWPRSTLAAQWRVTDVQEERLPADSAAWWGTGKVTEFAAAIADLPVLHQLVSSVRRDTCRWCGLELLGDRCAFCAAGLARPEPDGPAGQAPAPGVAAPGAQTELTAPASVTGHGPGPLGPGAPAPAGPPPAGPGDPYAPGPQAATAADLRPAVHQGIPRS
ncbi:hypothetical protein RM572_19765 [Streptomyces sp. DSM 42041]|uniref:Uncharacterized protein n=1 Tax=Streptomyces hazeniae TaxID=3075538 RepID=A0ABU2NVI5_9ACTN|nr:hypothetical protein [Streptomyces sp. DSM 42041]MDT0380997.1 hypothetical protein [Streptomyces sp. DSM 42041]